MCNQFKHKYLRFWGHEEIDMRLFTLPNYKMVNQNRRLSTHGGLITYVHEDFSYRELNADLPINIYFI